MLYNSKKEPGSFKDAGSSKGAKQPSGVCVFFNKKDATTGKHKCVRQRCTFAHKCSKCGSGAHSAFACAKA